MVHEGLKKLLNGVAAATRQAHRAPDSVTLIAVSKTFDGPEIIPVIEAGQRVFGENRVQEAKAKWPALKMDWPDVELHLIGPLQSNKTAEAVQLFDAIHTVDRPKIAAEIAKEMRKQAKPVKLFVQVNTGREPQKAGIDPDRADAFLAECRELHGLEISGLMCIPPAGEDPAPHFSLLAEIARRNGLSQLSMGMSGDYATAIACGATYVRVGSAIFGTRG
ncbi:MAG: YggS family pyridoxal phosphate-dependent enzyme [Aestuariivirga sp.]|uniref:YggS family pyridoxal phosphate-dependent enzyme n=1 Tax=Aestuariivirga sp. TaxID=2650926 RepID=UPI0025C59DB9|nr:YggS family pyridoxal phosphate-dependent enzyme [Aestuariivirga sp.]MCA3561720.1 YggS family pyridoxal phosphate-dependent enzyme [Aestuariivirga sp.]